MPGRSPGEGIRTDRPQLLNRFQPLARIGRGRIDDPAKLWPTLDKSRGVRRSVSALCKTFRQDAQLVQPHDLTDN
jgi:hypothetical protein